MHLSIRFEDENQIELGQGVAYVLLSEGIIRYEGYHIYQYTGQIPASGEHYTLYEESYADALNLTKKNTGTKTFTRVSRALR